jgi:hypothetical protein
MSDEQAVAEVAADTGTEVVEQPAVETEVADTGTEITPDLDKPEGQDESVEGDNRALPRDIQRTLKTLRDSGDPAQAKVARALNDSYFREQAFVKVFPKPSDAMAAKSTLDLVGGSEGISEMQSQLETMRLVDEDIANGRPEFLDDIIKTSPEGFKKIAPHVLNKLFNLDRDAYGNTVAPVIANTLRTYGVIGQDGKVVPEAFQRLVTDLEETLRQSKNVAENPKEKELSEREKKLNEREESDFRTSLGRTSNEHMNQQIQKHITPLLASMSSVKNDKAGFVTEVNAQINALLKQDANYQKNVKSLLREKNAEKITRYINAKLDEAVPKAVTAVKNTWQKRYGTQKPKVATNGNGAGPSGMLSKQPDVKDIDKVAGWQLLWMQGKGTIKGRAVSWKK